MPDYLELEQHVLYYGPTSDIVYDGEPLSSLDPLVGDYPDRDPVLLPKRL